MCFSLKPEQQRAFNRLKKAHADCLKAGVVFYNNYGNLGALDSSKFCHHYYDDCPISGVSDVGQNANELDIGCGEWADDPHCFHPINQLPNKETHNEDA